MKKNSMTRLPKLVAPTTCTYQHLEKSFETVRTRKTSYQILRGCFLRVQNMLVKAALIHASALAERTIMVSIKALP